MRYNRVRCASSVVKIRNQDVQKSRGYSLKQLGSFEAELMYVVELTIIL